MKKKIQLAISHYQSLVGNTFTAPELIAFVNGGVYRPDPVFRTNEYIGRYLKANATHFNIKEVRKNVKRNVNGVIASGSLYEII